MRSHLLFEPSYTAGYIAIIVASVSRSGRYAVRPPGFWRVHFIGFAHLTRPRRISRAWLRRTSTIVPRRIYPVARGGAASVWWWCWWRCIVGLRSVRRRVRGVWLLRRRGDHVAAFVNSSISTVSAAAIQEASADAAEQQQADNGSHRDNNVQMIVDPVLCVRSKIIQTARTALASATDAAWSAIQKVAVE